MCYIRFAGIGQKPASKKTVALISGHIKLLYFYDLKNPDDP